MTLFFTPLTGLPCRLLAGRGSSWLLTCLLVVANVISPLIAEERLELVKLSDSGYYSDVGVIKLRKAITSRSADLEFLTAAKIHILGGDLEKARYYLQKIDDYNSKVAVIKENYLAIIHFIEGEYRQSLLALARSEYKLSRPRETCMLKLLNNIGMNQYKAASRIYEHCALVLNPYITDHVAWLDMTLNLQVNSLRKLNSYLTPDKDLISGSNDNIRLWLKAGLYMNQEELLEQHIAKLPGDSFYSQSIRELIGLIYFRLGKYQRALDFIDDLHTPNAENIKGNVYLLQNKYELALGHFNLALKKKPTSINSLERVLALNWILGLWEEGPEILKRITLNDSKDIIPQLTLDAIFYLKQGKYRKVARNIGELEYVLNHHLPVELEMLAAYLGLVNDDKRLLARYSYSACRKFDGVSCWLAMQQLIWPDIGKTGKRDDPILDDSKWTLEVIKSPPLDVNPLSEVVYIEQDLIEELDRKDSTN
jgi:tetratricopeptide (TPR) repeat protein